MPTIPKILRGLPLARREPLLRLTPEHELLALNRHFPSWAHAGQLAPGPLGDGSPWRSWVLMAGRGFGKTRAGAEWVLDCVRGEEAAPLRHAPAVRATSPFVLRKNGEDQAGNRSSPFCVAKWGGGSREAADGGAGAARRTSRGRDRLSVPLHHGSAYGSASQPHGPPPRAGEDIRIALVAASIDEARRVMVEGESGILACAHPGEIADWSPTRRELRFAGGAIATLFSGASPQALRGPQHHIAWCDELAKWRHPDAAWDMLQLGLRLGANPRALVTTTPRGGCAVLARILAEPDTVQTGGATRANPHLPPAFLAEAERAYGGTRMGREELDGVLLPDIAGSLWPAALIESSRGPLPGEGALRRVVVGVDPPASAAGCCGIVVCGLTGEGEEAVGHVLADASAPGLSPEGWARAVAAAAERSGADRVVAERNMGGDMVESVLRASGLRLPVTLVSATRGKVRRAEPVAGLFERGEARLAGRFSELEDQLGAMVAGGGYEGPGSPDRADAMVWALWALQLAGRAEPRVRLP